MERSNLSYWWQLCISRLGYFDSIFDVWLFDSICPSHCCYSHWPCNSEYRAVNQLIAREKTINGDPFLDDKFDLSLWKPFNGIDSRKKLWPFTFRLAIPRFWLLDEARAKIDNSFRSTETPLSWFMQQYLITVHTLCRLSTETFNPLSPSWWNSLKVAEKKKGSWCKAYLSNLAHLKNVECAIYFNNFLVSLSSF